MKTTRRKIMQAVGAAALAPIALQGMSANTQAQQAADTLVRQGAAILTKSDSGGAKVVEVKLMGKKFDNGVLEQLQFFPDLETLRCLNTRLDDAFVKQLDRFSRLRVLGFFNAAITDAGLAALASSKAGGELRQLLLGRTKITDLGLKSIARLPRLYLLELSGTRVTDAGISELAQLAPLKVLRFRGTAVSDKGIAQLGQLNKLMLLSVGGSQVTSAGVAELRKQIPGLVVTDEEITLNVEER
jgi:internalin A